MITIIHGTDLVSSRELYFEEKTKSKNSIFLNGEGLTFEQTYQKIENKSLFDGQVSVFIENFLTKTKAASLEFKQISKYLNENKSADFFLWENSEISRSVLSNFPKADVKSFILAKNMFLFLDNITPKNSNYSIKLFHELKTATATELIFFMILRQFRILMAVSGESSSSIDELKRLAPWQISKFRKQLSFFGQEKLEKAYSKLFELERNHKTGKVTYSMDKSIDFFLASL